jgi:DNA-binding CsgD family transcriptional regulator
MPVGAVMLNVFSVSTAVGALAGLAALYVLLRRRGVLLLLLFVLFLSVDYLLGILLFAGAPAAAGADLPNVVFFSLRTRLIMAVKYLCLLGCFVAGPLAVHDLLGAPRRPGVHPALITAAAMIYALSMAQLLLAGSNSALPEFFIVLPVFTVYVLYTYLLILLLVHKGRVRSEFGRLSVRTAIVALVVIIPAMAFEDLYVLLSREPPRVFTDPLAFLSLTGITTFFTLLFVFRRQRYGFERQDLETLAIRHGLSEREQEVALLLLQGLKYKEIADRLCISLDTVKTHVSRIYRKTSTSNKTDLRHRIQLRSG